MKKIRKDSNKRNIQNLILYPMVLKIFFSKNLLVGSTGEINSVFNYINLFFNRLLMFYYRRQELVRSARFERANFYKTRYLTCAQEISFSY